MTPQIELTCKSNEILIENSKKEMQNKTDELQKEIKMHSTSFQDFNAIINYIKQKHLILKEDLDMMKRDSELLLQSSVAHSDAKCVKRITEVEIAYKANSEKWESNFTTAIWIGLLGVIGTIIKLYEICFHRRHGRQCS